MARSVDPDPARVGRDMEPASEKPPGLSFDADALGRPQTWTVHHRGLEYRGEVIVAEAVDPDWALPLDGAVSFRLVFYTVPRRISDRRLQDPRIAMAVPRRSLTQVWQTLGREIQYIHETRQRYITARDAEALTMRRSMEDREQSVRGEMARQYAHAYYEGRVYSHARVKVRSRDIFSAETPESWAEGLASAVLEQVYPDLPMDHRDFPHTLTYETIEGLFRGLFHGDADAADAVRAFGPGLGLTRRQDPELFDANLCPVLDIIQRELDSRNGEMPARDMIGELTYTHGLTPALALLYVVAFVRQLHAEIELGHDHRVEDRRGAPFLGDRITWDMVPAVSFSESLAESFASIRLRPSPTLKTALPYAALLLDVFAVDEGIASTSDQESLLSDVVGRMAPQISRARDGLRSIEGSLGAVPSGATESLEGLQELCAVSDNRELYFVAQERFRGPAGLTHTLGLYRRVQELSGLLPAIESAKAYLDRMTFGREHQELSLERDSVAARIEPVSLLADPVLWSSVEESFFRLRARYTSAYAPHHARYHGEGAQLANRLEALRPQVEALTRFNQMRELGEPVGGEVHQLYGEVSSALKTCALAADELSLDTRPQCRGCLLTLDEYVPLRAAERLIGSAEAALREYNRRLGSHSVRQVLAQPSREQLDRYMDLLRVADPSALATVLDDEVVAFLRQFLARG